MMMTLNIAKEFATVVGARTRDESDFSGEEFREELLIPRFEQARRKGTKLLVIFAGMKNYPTSFLEESFGGLARKFSVEEVLKVLRLGEAPSTAPYLINDVRRYICQERPTPRVN